VWLFGGMLALVGGLMLVSLAALASLAVTIWAIVDACRHPDPAWRRIGQSRAVWVALLLAGWLMTGVIGLLLALVYLIAVRPRVMAAAREAAPRPPVPPEHVRLALRASDADRDQAGAWLRHHYTVGRLTHDELLQRLDEAYAARTVADLEHSLRELPQW
jgi:type VI protein secretion system component VasK